MALGLALSIPLHDGYLQTDRQRSRGDGGLHWGWLNLWRLSWLVGVLLCGAWTGFLDLYMLGN